MQAGRIMLRRLDELADASADFAFETTLASRHFAKWIRQLKQRRKYRFHLIFLWLPSADHAVGRVARRVRLGGHHVDEETVRRRYRSGLRNFFELYRPLANRWSVYDNSGVQLRLIAAGLGPRLGKLPDPATWQYLVQEYGHGTNDEDG